MKSMQDAFELKLKLMENENKSTIMNLEQDQTRKDEENKQLKGELAKLRTELNRTTDNNLNYDSPEEEDDDNDVNYDSPEDDDNYNNDINYDTPEEEGDKYDINYDTECNENDDTSNDINYNTECSENEEDMNRNTSKTVHQNPNKSAP